jgi:hypothetical protein
MFAIVVVKKQGYDLRLCLDIVASRDRDRKDFRAVETAASSSPTRVEFTTGSVVVPQSRKDTLFFHD